ncbi:MAG: prenyltransferase [Limnochordaceae bacterium]|nr:prenyltransferase [Limnochordaceae bacterium]
MSAPLSPATLPARSSGWKTWLMASRPFSLTASVIPITLGALLAVREGVSFHILWFVLALVGGTLLQVGTNFVNTYYDYMNGVDTREQKASIQPWLVLGWFSPGAVLAAGYLAFSVSALIGLYFIYVRGWLIAAIGLAGLLGGYWYTAGPVHYKYRGLGVPLVFVLMGPLETLGGYVTLAGHLSWTPIAAALPVACLVAAILHGNDLRDFETDREGGMVSLSHWLGWTASIRLYDALLAGAYVFALLNVAVGILPIWSLLVLATVPAAWQLMRRVHAGGQCIIPVEPLTAKLHMQFGLALSLSILVAGWFPLPWPV